MTVSEYLAKLTPEQVAQFDHVRTVVKKLVPEAEEVISYGLPTLTYKKKYLIYWGAFKDHTSLFPGTIKFAPSDTIPESVITDIVQKRYKLIVKAK